ncbi:cytochrome P450 [Rhodococcus aetherivorans]|uniref:cytochrome P450 n=1 Tax=Rhodococcus aetherivorans TaxID=191292 RepID=UPI0002D243CA|nr:cytochrome P450 [Rhodococcus aetherivorans]CCW12641.1 putative cytochrome P450 hydroxylase [Rhodococcus aetherivorans]
MTSSSRAGSRPYDPLNVSQLSFWASSAEEREKVFRVLRNERPVSWHPPVEGGLMPPENDGFWAVTDLEHIVEVSTHPEIFCSGGGIQFEEVPEEILEAASSFLAMDGPQHMILRKLMSSAFTPKQVNKIEAQIKAQAATIVDDLVDGGGEGDFVKQVSMRLPRWTIYEMLGLPEDLREEAAHHADGMVSWADEDVAGGREPGEVLNDSLVGLLAMGMEFAEETRKHPRNDIWTNLVNAEVDGQRLTEEELGSFFVLLSVAGNDTTRNTITLGTKAFYDFPDQKALLLNDFSGRIGGAIEEVVRWVTPVMTFRRTVTQDTILGGQELREGEWVAMFYASGNRDEKVFDDPWKFDIERTPNRHVAFGGGGPHYCMGNFLAKIQLRHIFDQLLHRVPDLQLGDPQFLVGNFVNAVKSMPYKIG